MNDEKIVNFSNEPNRHIRNSEKSNKMKFDNYQIAYDLSTLALLIFFSFSEC